MTHRGSNRLPEPIREAKIAEPSSPLGYRSGIDDRKQNGSAPELDSGAIRAIMFLVAIPVGLFVAAGTHFLLVGILSILESPILLLLAIHFAVLLSECALLAKILKAAEARSRMFYLGLVAGTMVISAGLTAILLLKTLGN